MLYTLNLYNVNCQLYLNYTYICVYMCVHIYIHIYKHSECVCVCVYIYIHTHTHSLQKKGKCSSGNISAAMSEFIWV